MKTTIYMFNEQSTEFDDVIKEEKLEGDDPYVEVFPTNPLSYEARFFYQKRRKQPKWLGFISGNFDTADFENHTCSFLILLRTQGRIFAITKGFSSHLFNRNKLENHFGLKVCLNEVNPDSIKCMDSRSLETNTKHKRVVVSKNSYLSNFDFNPDIELINLVSGKPSAQDLAKSMTGSDPITFTRDEISIDQLEEVCQQLLESFQKTDYQEQFSFIDDIQPIKNEVTIGFLDEQLLEDFTNLNLEEFLITYPDMPDLELIERWKLGRGRCNREFDELSIENVAEFLHQFNGINDIDPSEIYVLCLDGAGNAIRGRKKLDEYLSFEKDIDGKKYIYARRKWYVINPSFMERITLALNKIEVEDQGYLPDWESTNDEGEYNELVALSEDNRHLLDRKTLQIDGRGKIEVCDILESPANFIHVKKYYSSQTMGHLFNQGTISAQVLREDIGRISEWLEKEYPDFDRTEIVNQENITVIFAIGFKNLPDSIIERLPFFSKVVLFNAKKTIEKSCDFDIKLCAIPIIDQD